MFKNETVLKHLKEEVFIKMAKLYQNRTTQKMHTSFSTNGLPEEFSMN
jgi:hypothetical protein